MNYKIWNHILLELVMAVSGEKELDLLYKKSSNAFLRKLNSVQVAFIRQAGSFYEPVFSVPVVMENDSKFISVVNQLQSEDPDIMQPKVFELGREDYFYVYPLKGFGMLVFRRSLPIDHALFNELSMVTEILSNNCLAVEERIRRESAEERLQERVTFQKFLMDTALMFINIPLQEINTQINQALRSAGEFTGADRAYVFDYDFEKQVTNNTFEYCAEGISPEIDNLQEVPLEYIQEDWVIPHTEGRYVLVEDVTKLDQSSALYQILHPQGIITLITLPMIYHGKCLGFIGFDAVAEKKEWTEDEITLLKVLAEVFTNAKIRLQHEKELITSRLEAESASKAKSDFLANMSHEIRTPLNGIVSTLYLLEGTTLLPEQEAYLTMTRDSVDSLLSVIEDILDFSKIESGTLDIIPVPYNIEEDFYKTAKIFSAQASEKNIEIISRFSTDGTNCVIGDRLRIRQIMLNLISNAVKFTDAGFIFMNLNVTKYHNNVILEFSIQDSGKGIPEHLQEAVFKKFIQAESSASRKHTGTGLGLAISKELVELMGGTIGLESEKDKGSTFFFRLSLPFCEPVDTCKDADKCSYADPLQILIIDDQPLALNAIAEMLEYKGHTVVKAMNMTEAMDELNKIQTTSRPFDIVLVDFLMPGQDGIKTGEFIKSQEQCKDTKLILMSSEISNHKLTDLEKKGFDGLLFKPLTNQELYYKIFDVLSPSESEKKLPEIPLNDDERTNDEFHILLVDDHHNNRKVARMLLNKMGLKVTEAQSGIESLELLKDQNFDLILMDIQMPDMDGYEATRRIKKMPYPKNTIPVVALSANASAEDGKKSIEAGMEYHLSKPFKISELQKIINTYV